MGVGRRISCLALAALALTGASPATQPAAGTACSFPEVEVAWIQRALNGWEQVSRDFLRTNPTPLPWIVLFDQGCVWHLNAEANVGRVVDTSLTFAGRAVPVRASAHEGTFLLPSGAPGEVEMKASTSLYRSGRAAFFAMGMPSLWRTKDVSGPTRAEYLLGVFSHEMTHVRLLPVVNRRVKEIARLYDLPLPMNDDIVQEVFWNVDGFQSAINRERDQFYRAIAAPASDKRATLARRGLDLARARRARYYAGPNEGYAEIESLFLMLEGVGHWAAYRLSKARIGHELESIRLIRADRRYWSQDEGLAMFILIDALLPGWQSRIFSGSLASPFDLLEEALR